MGSNIACSFFFCKWGRWTRKMTGGLAHCDARNIWETNEQKRHSGLVDTYCVVNPGELKESQSLSPNSVVSRVGHSVTENAGKIQTFPVLFCGLIYFVPYSLDLWVLKCWLLALNLFLGFFFFSCKYLIQLMDSTGTTSPRLASCQWVCCQRSHSESHRHIYRHIYLYMSMVRATFHHE